MPYGGFEKASQLMTFQLPDIEVAVEEPETAVVYQHDIGSRPSFNRTPIGWGVALNQAAFTWSWILYHLMGRLTTCEPTTLNKPNLRLSLFPCTIITKNTPMHT